MGYDLAIVPRFDNDYGYFAGLFSFLSHAKNRIGYTENTSVIKISLDKGYNSFYTYVLPIDDLIKHEVDRGLDIIRYLGGTVEKKSLELWCSADDCKKAKRLINYDDRGNVKRIVLFMTAGSHRREWDESNFRRVIEDIVNVNSYKYQFVLMGYGTDAKLKAAYIKRNFSDNEVLDLTGKTTIRETYAVIALCDIYLGGDTGPMHMAVAADLPGVVISCHPKTGSLEHYNSPTRFGPYNDKMMVIRPDPFPGCEKCCTHEEAHCINNISVDEVCRALKKFL